LAGALLKLADSSPSHLPVALIKWLGALNVDLMFVLRFSIAAELTVVGVMWFLPRLGRWAGVVMLGAFIPVLLGDVLMGASSCGCFGALEIHPAVTLVMDVAFFLGLLVLGRGVPSLRLTGTLPTFQVVIAGLWTVVSFAVAFAPMSGTSADVGPENGETVAVLPADGYYMPLFDTWVGQTWEELPISSWVRGGPDDLTSGDRYVLFYRKDCEHCHELMEVFFSGPLMIPMTAIAVPDRDGFPADTLPFACVECDTAELPSGVDWFIQTPVLVRLTDGVVQCAAETTAADPVCVEF
jgi:hypothetical protein